MKLRDKKTGAIYNIEDIDLGNNKDGIWLGLTLYKSLADFNKDWEDYEEQKEYWWIDYDGKVKSFIDLYEWQDKMKDIGNYFNTREEAEKAVEKLKAAKRLKDKGFKIIGVRGLGKVIDFDIPEPYNHVGYDEYNASKDEKEFYDDLLLLFGGEE